MKDAYYFPHDSNARQDPNILSMRSIYGTEGYGWYWIIVEMMREQENYMIQITKYVWNALAMQMQCDAHTAEEFVTNCINEFDLFSTDGDYFWSDSLVRRMEKVDEKSRKARDAAKKRWEKPNDIKPLMPKQSESNADAMQTHSEGNAIKENKTKEKKRKSQNEYTPEFTAFWSVYPRPLGKLDAFDKWLKALEAGAIPETITACAENYAKQCKHYETEERYIMHPKTFLYKARFLDFEKINLSDPKPRNKVVQMKQQRPITPVVRSEAKEATEEDVKRITALAQRLTGG